MFIYHYLFTLVLKSPDGEWPITYTFTFTFTFKNRTRKFSAKWQAGRTHGGYSMITMGWGGKLLGEWKLIWATAFWGLLARMANALKIKCPTLPEDERKTMLCVTNSNSWLFALDWSKNQLQCNFRRTLGSIQKRHICSKMRKNVACFLTYLQCSDRIPDPQILRGAKNYFKPRPQSRIQHVLFCHICNRSLFVIFVPPS